jgi:hypothetical protein
VNNILDVRWVGSSDFSLLSENLPQKRNLNVMKKER